MKYGNEAPDILLLQEAAVPASAAVAFKLGLCGNNITVKMQGGDLSLEFKNDFSATMIGPVIAVCNGIIKEDFFTKSKR